MKSVGRADDTGIILSFPGHPVKIEFTDRGRYFFSGVLTWPVATGQVALKPGMKLKERFDGLRFITGTAQFGYDLKKGVRYSVVAVSWPSGSKGSGICSQEAAVDLK